jgi:hypothetical protein
MPDLRYSSETEVELSAMPHLRYSSKTEVEISAMPHLRYSSETEVKERKKEKERNTFICDKNNYIYHTNK